MRTGRDRVYITGGGDDGGEGGGDRRHRRRGGFGWMMEVVVEDVIGGASEVCSSLALEVVVGVDASDTSASPLDSCCTIELVDDGVGDLSWVTEDGSEVLGPAPQNSRVSCQKCCSVEVEKKCGSFDCGTLACLD
nr:unnamed protein product [Spirometra erinaceieuropaei]